MPCFCCRLPPCACFRVVRGGGRRITSNESGRRRTGAGAGRAFGHAAPRRRVAARRPSSKQEYGVNIYHNASSQPMTRPREVSGGGAGAGAPWRARTDTRVDVGPRAFTAASWADSSQTSNPSGRVLAWTSPPKCLRPRRRESFCVSAGGGGGGGGLSSSGSEGGATGGGGSSRW